MAVRINFMTQEERGASPLGRASFEFSKFESRFAHWSPAWEWPVRLASERIGFEDLRVAQQVYGDSPPFEDFSNGDSVLLFAGADHFELVETDYFTRLLFTEPDYLAASIMVEGRADGTVSDLLRAELKDSLDAWRHLGLPGRPLCIGVNVAVRSTAGAEALAFKGPNSAAGMGHTVGPGISGALKLAPSAVSASETLESLIDAAVRAVAERELGGQVPGDLSRIGAWLDAGRGSKPEVSYELLVAPRVFDRLVEALMKEHAGVLCLEGHLDGSGRLSREAQSELSSCGLNFQAWMPWSPPSV